MGVRVRGVHANGAFQVLQRTSRIVHQLEIDPPQAVPRRHQGGILDQRVPETGTRALRILRLQVKHSDPNPQQGRVGIRIEGGFQLSNRHPDRIGMVRIHGADVDRVDIARGKRVCLGRTPDQ